MNDLPTVKQKIIEMLHRLPDDLDFDRAIESICLLRRIERGLRESETGVGTEHDEFMRELLRD